MSAYAFGALNRARISSLTPSEAAATPTSAGQPAPENTNKVPKAVDALAAMFPSEVAVLHGLGVTGFFTPGESENSGWKDSVPYWVLVILLLAFPVLAFMAGRGTFEWNKGKDSAAVAASVVAVIAWMMISEPSMLQPAVEDISALRNFLDNGVSAFVGAFIAAALGLFGITYAKGNQEQAA